LDNAKYILISVLSTNQQHIKNGLRLDKCICMCTLAKVKLQDVQVHIHFNLHINVSAYSSKD